jgi:hypothetical protein
MSDTQNNRTTFDRVYQWVRDHAPEAAGEWMDRLRYPTPAERAFQVTQGDRFEDAYAAAALIST